MGACRSLLPLPRSASGRAPHWPSPRPSRSGLGSAMPSPRSARWRGSPSAWPPPWLQPGTLQERGSGWSRCDLWWSPWLWGSQPSPSEPPDTRRGARYRQMPSPTSRGLRRKRTAWTMRHPSPSGAPSRTYLSGRGPSASRPTWTRPDAGTDAHGRADGCRCRSRSERRVPCTRSCALATASG